MDRHQAETDTLWVCILCSLFLIHVLEGKGEFKDLKSDLMKVAEVSPVPANTLAEVCPTQLSQWSIISHT